MNRSAIKKFATWARAHLLEQIAAKATQYGITEKAIATPQIISGGMVLNGQTYDKDTTHLYLELHQHLERQLEHHDLKTTVNTLIDDMAYTWFNRLAALRYMEANDYIEKVLSSSQHSDTMLLDPDLLQHASSLIASGELGDVTLADLDTWRKQGDELTYQYLLNAQCRALAKSLPYLFEARSYAALFIPNNLLNQTSLVRKLVSDIPTEDWQDIEIIGWLYQFYISDRKDEVIGAKSTIEARDIPAATQLFTPHWIVRYMVENAVGRLWLESHPESRLREHMPYYLESEQSNDSPPIETHQPVKTLKQSPINFEVTANPVSKKIENPQDLTVLDPACGSGHILVYAFDLLYLIYQEQGYPERDIPALILEHNLFGLDIDERAVQLASFALMMKARARNRRILRDPPRLNLLALQATDYPLLDVPELNKPGWQPLLEAFKHADNLGSLISPPAFDHDKLQAQLDAFSRSGRTQITDLPQLEHLLVQARMLSQTYQAVVANPPYMGNKGFNKIVKDFVNEYYPKSKSDLFAVFMERGIELTKPFGIMATINQHAWMFLSSYEKLREHVLENQTLETMLHLGARAFPEIGGEVVQSTTFTLRNRTPKQQTVSYVRLVDYNSSEEKEKAFLAGENRFYRNNQKDFEKIPGSPIAYWVSEKVLEAFEKYPQLSDTVEAIGKGLDTGNNDRFLRNWFEVNNSEQWKPLQKGGDFRKWYGNHDYVINWKNNGSDLSDFSGSNMRNAKFYFRNGISWTRVSSSSTAFRAFGSGFVFESTGPCIFASEDYLNGLIGFLNSQITTEKLKILAPTLDFQSGHISKLPVIQESIKSEKIAQISNCCINLSKSDWDNFETSWDFQTHPLLRGGFKRVAEAFEDWRKTSDEAFFELKRLEEENNRYWIAAYGLQDELSPEVPEEQITIRRADLVRDVKSLVSYAVGCMMGRYSLAKPGLVFAGGSFDMSLYPEDFKPDDDGIIPITDAAYFEDDISLRFEKFLRVAFGEAHLSENLGFVADALGRKASETSREAVRRYFIDEFISDHIRTYSKRPIYWLFSSGKQRAFNALVYLHRYTPDTLAKMRTAYLLEMQTKLAGEIERFENEYESASTASAKKTAQRRLKELNAQALELRGYLDKVQHVADKRIEIDLDDGVAYNYTLFEGLVYEGSELKMADLKAKSAWKRELLAGKG